MGKPASPRFRQMVGKIHDMENFLPTSSITEKRPRTPETGIKDGFEEMEHEFPFGIFRPEKQDYLIRCSVVLGNFPLERPKKSCSIHFPTGFSEKRFVNDKQSVIPVRNKNEPEGFSSLAAF